MPGFTERELLQIIAAGESDRVEFKESLSGEKQRLTADIRRRWREA